MRIFGYHVKIGTLLLLLLVALGFASIAAPAALFLLVGVLVLACPVIMLWMMRAAGGRLRFPEEYRDDRPRLWKSGPDPVEGDIGLRYEVALLKRRQGELERKLLEVQGDRRQATH